MTNRLSAEKTARVYVEILVRAPMDLLWSHTQTPGLHEKWDLRFSRIDYLPKRRGSRTSHAADAGSHEHLAVDIDLSVDESGGLRLRSDAQRFYEGAIGFSFPMLFTGDVREWYDDAAHRFRIVVEVHNKVWGPLFGYRGSFDVEWRKVGAGELPTYTALVYGSC